MLSSKNGRLTLNRTEVTPENALDLTILKWELLVENPYLNSVGSSSCALCHLYLKNPEPCRGCPVFRKTGVRYCGNTPYVRFNQGDREVAQEELDFLVSLRSSLKRGA